MMYLFVYSRADIVSGHMMIGCETLLDAYREFQKANPRETKLVAIFPLCDLKTSPPNP